MSISNMMSITIFSSIFVMVYNVPLPDICPGVNVKNNARSEVLDLIDRALQGATELKNMTGNLINRGKEGYDALPPYDGFPSIVSSSNCSICQIFLSIFVIVYNVPLPDICPGVNVKNNARSEVLDLIHRALQDATELKNMAGNLINPGKEVYDVLPPYEGFPSIVSSSNCSICQIDECYRRDYESLETLIRYMNSQISVEFTDNVVGLTNNINNIIERMKCDRVSIVFDGIIQDKSKDYRISKDIVVLFKTLINKYNYMEF